MTTSATADPGPTASNGPNRAAKLAAATSGDRDDASLAVRVIDAAGPNANPRLVFLVSSLVSRLHEFAIDVDLQHGEWMSALDLINRAGLMSPVRNEMQLLCDVIGLESLVDSLTNSRQPGNHAHGSSTSSAILGPFYKGGAPIRRNGESIASSAANAKHASQTARVRGRVFSALTGRPIQGAVVDVWHADPDGVYDCQDGSSPADHGDLRGVFATDDAGAYDIYCLRPGPYPLPLDGPAGELLRLLDRHPWRPAHIHFKVSATGFRPLTTQVFDAEDRYLQNDTVFAVKDDLRVHFREGSDPRARFDVQFDFRLEEVDA